MKNKRYKEDSFFIECLQEFLAKMEANTLIPPYMLGVGQKRQMAVFTLGCFLYPKEMKKAIKCFKTNMFSTEEETAEYIMKFHDALYNFSMEKVSCIMEDKYFALFLSTFLRVNSENIVPGKDEANLTSKNLQEIMRVFGQTYSQALQIIYKKVTDVSSALIEEPSMDKNMAGVVASPIGCGAAILSEQPVCAGANSAWQL